MDIMQCISAMPESHNSRICFISSRCGFVDESGNLFIDWANGRLLRELVNKIPTLSIAVFTEKRKAIHQSFEIRAEKLYELPGPFSQLGGIRNSILIYKRLKQIQKDHDLLIVQLPFIGFLVLGFLYRPTIFHVCANVLTASRNPFKYKGIKLLVTRIAAFILHNWFKTLFTINKSKVIVNGSELGQLYRRHDPKVVISSSVFETEIISKNDLTERQSPESFKILFIGRPSKEKGFPTLLNALIGLSDAGLDLKLSMLGVTLAEFNKLLGYSIDDKYLSRISFHGYLPWGHDFKQMVKSSHCLVMSSISEGTPRVIVEAMALGCPVVASRVGGVAAIININENGLLFDPLDSDGLAAAIRTLYFNEVLRQRIIMGGIESAHGHTLEQFTKAFIDSINVISK